MCATVEGRCLEYLVCITLVSPLINIDISLINRDISLINIDVSLINIEPSLNHIGNSILKIRVSTRINIDLALIIRVS